LRISDLAVNVRVEVEWEPRKEETSDCVRMDVDFTISAFGNYLAVLKLPAQIPLTCLVMPRKCALERQKPRPRRRSICIESVNRLGKVSQRSLLDTLPVLREEILIISANISQDGSPIKSLILRRTFATVLSNCLSASFSWVHPGPNTDGSHGRTEGVAFRVSESVLDPKPWSSPLSRNPSSAGISNPLKGF
jgi:hypothetical protein